MFPKFPKSLFILLVIQLNYNIVVESVSIERDLTITYPQKQILDKFKELVTPNLPHDYMKEEIYLIRWLRATDFNLERAKDMLYKNLRWRTVEKMDEILDEDFKGLENKFRHPIIGLDKQDRPILYTDVGTWDLRSAVLTGTQRKIQRFLSRGLEDISIKIRNLQSEGRNVTQYYHIYNLEGFNLIQHGCAQCLGALLNTVTTYDNYYPGLAHKVVIVNSPALFEPMFQTIQLAFSDETRQKFNLYGRNKKRWQQVLLEDIDKSVLPYELGGSNILTEDDY